MHNFLLGIMLFSVLTASAQTKPKPKPKTSVPAKKIVPAQPPVLKLKNLADSMSYAIGANIAQSITKDFEELNVDVFVNAFKAIVNKQKPLLDEAQSRAVIMEFSEKEQAKLVQPQIEAGAKLWEANLKNNKIVTTKTGLQYEVLKEGTGSKPTIDDTVVCNYKGMLLDSTEFDNSYSRGEPLTIPVSGVIKGWTEGLQLMTVGSKYKFFVPQQLGYGLRGAPPSIPGGSMLIFEVELLEIKK